MLTKIRSYGDSTDVAQIDEIGLTETDRNLPFFFKIFFYYYFFPQHFSSDKINELEKFGGFFYGL